MLSWAGVRTHNVLRRFPLAGLLAAVMVLFIPIFSLLFMQLDSVLGDEDHLNTSEYSSGTSDRLRLSGQFTTPLIIGAVVTAMAPLIELTKYFVRPLKLQPVKQLAATTAAFNGTADRPHNRLWKLYHYWFAHMSKSAMVGLLVYTGWTVASFALVCKHVYADKTHFDFPFSSYYAQEYNGFTPSTADKWIYMFGLAAIPPLMLNYFLTLLPAARTSSLLNTIGMSFEESMNFHKMTGFAAAFWAVVHGVFCQLPTANVPNGHKWAWIQWWDPSHPSSEWVFWGQVAMFMQVFIVACSLKWVRMNKYWTFRVVHLLFPFVLATTSAHYYTFWYWTQPGVMLLLADAAARVTFAVSKSTVTLSCQRASKTEEVVTLQVLSPFNPATTGRDQLYGRFFYLQLPDISMIEWHPMTMTDFQDGIITFVIKVNGDEGDDIWTRKLQAMAHSTEGVKSYPVRLEGPYGYDFLSTVVDRVQAQGNVVFIAGGSGIAPFTAALSHMSTCKQLRPLLSRIHLVWSAKNYATLQAFEPSLRSAVAAGLQITVHVTGGGADVSGHASSHVSGSKAAITSGPTAAPVADVTDVSSSRTSSSSGSDSHAASFAAGASASAAQGKRRKFWHPSSPLYRWFVGAILVYLSIIGSTTGWFLGRLSTGEDYDSKYPARTERLAKLEVQYNATVAANYAAETGTALKPEQWPEGQAVFANFYLYEQWFFGEPKEALYCYPMNGIPNRVVAAWKYGQPVPCQGLGYSWTAQGFIWSLYSWVLGAMLTLAGGYMFRRQRERYDQQASPLMTGMAAVHTQEAALRSKQLQTAALTDDAALCFPVTAGRPALGPYLSSVLNSAADSTGKVTAIDVYVSGPEVLQQGARLAYDRRIKPAVNGSSFLPLSYTIG